MIMNIAKEFRWEMGHRLPFHEGLCRNIHGHSYKMRLELEGTPGKNSMIIDYFDIYHIVGPIVQSLDHAFLCDESDKLMIDFLEANGFKHVVTDKVSTVENMVEYMTGRIVPEFGKFDNISAIKVRIYETEDAYAELRTELK